MRKAIYLDIDVTHENFDEDLYLAANPDIRTAVYSGAYKSGREHFEKHGYQEKRRMREAARVIEAERQAKLAKLGQVLRRDIPFRDRNGKPDYLSDELVTLTKIQDTNNISSNSYDDEVLALIERHASGLVLDCGSGRRNIYFPNVVNYEIVDYDTTDVIGVGECLPFAENSFDAVLSIAVLEHVRDPFLCAREIARVLKPGGELFCSVPFLQPYHGYPHHYFNATHQGIRCLFEDMLTISDIRVPAVGHPAFTLHWFLSSWMAGLQISQRERFQHLTVQDMLNSGPHLLASEFGGLTTEATVELACSFSLRAIKSL